MACLNWCYLICENIRTYLHYITWLLSLYPVAKLQTKIKRCNFSPGMYWHNGIDCSKRITKQFRKTETRNKKLNVPVPYAVTQTPPWSCKVVFFITCVYCSGLLVSSCFTNKIKINMVSSLYYTFVENIRVRT